MSMISLSVLKELNTYGFGANTDRLRMYLNEVCQQYELGCPIEQYEQFNRLRNLLKEVDPDSKLLSTQIDTTSSDVARGSELTKQKESLQSIGQEIDLVAYIRSDGVSVTVEYEYGRLKQAYTLVNFVLIDLTEKLKDNLVKEVDDWKNEPSVTIQGHVAIPRKNLGKIKQAGFRNLNHAIVHFVTQKDYSYIQKYVRFIADGLTFESNESKGLTVWESLSLLKIKGFEVPQRIKASGVMDQNLDQAVAKMINYFDNFDTTNEFEYVYTGVVFEQNNQYIRDTYGLRWCINTRKDSIKQVYRGRLQKIEWKPCGEQFKAVLKLDEITESGRETGKKIEYDGVQLRTLDRKNINLGKILSIKKMIDGTKILCDEYGQEL